MFNRQFTKNILRDLKKEENSRFRHKCNINERDLVLFLGLGNRIWEHMHMVQSIDAIEKLAYWVKARYVNMVLVVPTESTVNQTLMKELSEKLGVRVICP